MTNTVAKPRPLTRERAQGCLLLNQLVTPGLGTLMAGRRVTGWLQVLLAGAGFVLVVGWFAQFYADLHRQFSELPPQPWPYPWMGKVGLLLFVAAWLWALVSSISILRSVRVPPKLE
ncbi:MAG: hypothetical protein AB1705_10975 [Verrucomicrobiota bacterium]